MLDQPEQAAQLIKERFNINLSIVGATLSGLVDLEKITTINNMLFEAGITIKFVENKKRTLEDLFLNLTDKHKIT